MSILLNIIISLGLIEAIFIGIRFIKGIFDRTKKRPPHFYVLQYVTTICYWLMLIIFTITYIKS